jgi:hypothetical protein
MDELDELLIPKSRRLGEEPPRERRTPPDKEDASISPRRSRARPATREKKSLETPLKESLLLMARVWEIRDPICGGALKAAAPDIAAQANGVAMTDARFYRFLNNMLKGGGYGGLMLSVYPVLATVREHHVKPTIEKMRARRAGEEVPEEFQRPEPSQAPTFETFPAAEMPVSEGSVVSE